MPMDKCWREFLRTDDYLAARAKSRKRARGRCQHCNVEDRTIRNAARIMLCTRHLNGNLADNADSNLKQLCQRCHFADQRRVRRELS